MKSLIEFIKENLETFRLNSVNVKYDCKPKDFILEAPNTYQESDIQQYLDDRLLQNLPSSNNLASKFFGENMNNIYDSYFEYENFEHILDKTNIYPNLKWDAKYNQGETKDIKLDYFKLSNLKYIISFDKFDLLDTNENNIKETLDKIFLATVSNSINKYPIEISLNTNNIEYYV